MVIVVWGHKYDFDPIGTVDAACPKCGAKPCELKWAHKKGTVYWVPLFNMETSYALWCESCQEHWLIDKAEGQRLHFGMQNAKPGEAGSKAPRTPHATTVVNGKAAATCAGCGNGLPQAARFCPECGAAVSRPTACSACGKEQSSGKFCAECGGVLSV